MTVTKIKSHNVLLTSNRVFQFFEEEKFQKWLIEKPDLCATSSAWYVIRKFYAKYTRVRGLFSVSSKTGDYGIWYLTTNYIDIGMVFCYQNCSDLLWEKLWKFEADGQEFAKFMRSLEQFVQTVKVQNNFR